MADDIQQTPAQPEVKGELASSNEVVSQSNEVKFELTEANILFLKHIQSGMKVKDAYKAAGYESLLPNVPYQFYWKLKKKLEALVEADNLDGLRLRLELSKIINLPLASLENPHGISVGDKLKAIKVTHEIVEGKGRNDTKPTITAFVVQRFEQPTGQGNDQAKPIDTDAVIDAQQVRDEDVTRPDISS